MPSETLHGEASAAAKHQLLLGQLGELFRVPLRQLTACIGSPAQTELAHNLGTNGSKGETPQ